MHELFQRSLDAFHIRLESSVIVIKGFKAIARVYIMDGSTV